jgi:hypothetical protein
LKTFVMPWWRALMTRAMTTASKVNTNVYLANSVVWYKMSRHYFNFRIHLEVSSFHFSGGSFVCFVDHRFMGRFAVSFLLSSFHRWFRRRFTDCRRNGPRNDKTLKGNRPLKDKTTGMAKLPPKETAYEGNGLRNSKPTSKLLYEKTNGVKTTISPLTEPNEIRSVHPEYDAPTEYPWA